MKQTNGQGHLSGPSRAGGQPRSHSKDTRGSAWERGTRTGSVALASQVGSKRCSGETLEGCLATAARQHGLSQAPGRGGEGTDGRTAAWPGRRGPAPSHPQHKPGDGEQPAPAPQQLPQDRSWAPNPCSQDHTPHDPHHPHAGQRRAFQISVAPQVGCSWTGGRQLRGESWWGQPRPPTKPYTPLCQA